MENFDWSKLNGLSESKAEDLLFEAFGCIPEFWNDPITRGEILGGMGATFLAAHMNDGELKYGGDDRLGNRARDIWYRRNIEGQGFPDELDYLNRES